MLKYAKHCRYLRDQFPYQIVCDDESHSLPSLPATMTPFIYNDTIPVPSSLSSISSFQTENVTAFDSLTSSYSKDGPSPIDYRTTTIDTNNHIVTQIKEEEKLMKAEDDNLPLPVQIKEEEKLMKAEDDNLPLPVQIKEEEEEKKLMKAEDDNLPLPVQIKEEEEEEKLMKAEDDNLPLPVQIKEEEEEIIEEENIQDDEGYYADIEIKYTPIHEIIS